MASLSILSLLLVAAYIIYREASRFLYNTLVKNTVIAALPLLGQPRKSKLPGNAVVCGGSVAGMFAARVLADHYEHVLIIEPEEWVTTEEGLQDDPLKKRTRVSQYTFMHGYQIFLALVLQKMFGDRFEEELQRGGGRMFKGPFNAYFDGRVPPGKWWKNAPKQLHCRRSLLETTVRRLLLRSCSNVRYVHGTAVELIRKSQVGPIDGVRVMLSNSSENMTVIPAGLVADCTGAAAAGFQWLKALGMPSLDDVKTSYVHNAMYSFCEVDMPESLLSKIKTSDIAHYSGEPDNGPIGINFWIPDASRERRVFGLIRQEKNILHIAFGGWGTPINEAPQSLAQLRELVSGFSLTIPVPEWVFQMLELFERENAPHKFSSRRLSPPTYIQYHLAKDLPYNFVALGDAIHQSNPMRGYGTMKSSMDATTLNAVLAQCQGDTLPSNFGERFFSLQATHSGGIWDACKTEDYSWDTTVPAKGESLTSGQLVRSYSKYFVRMATEDPSAHADLLYINSGITPALAFFLPHHVAKCFWLWIKVKLGFVSI